VVICGGGWAFFPSVYVTVRVLRHVGCRLPIQVWYLGDRGEFDPRMEAALRPYDVGWVDANALWRDRPGVAIRRGNIDHGWMLKPFAAAFAPFREVVCLDADSYPVSDPERLLDHPEFRRVGACFWPDMNPLQKGQFERLGVPPSERPLSFESGQFLVDKGRHWEPLWLTAWLNAHHEYVWGPGYRHLYGDKDTFLMAWLKLGRAFCLPSARPGWSHPAFLQRGFDGKTAFVHRTRDKFRFFGPVDGARVTNRYNTAQAAPDRQHYNPDLPHEDLCHALARECDQLITPGRTFRFRAGTHDEAIWQQVTLGDEYRLPELSGGTVLDGGGHVGSFAWAALRRGAGAVHSYEPHPDTAALLRANASVLGARVSVFEEALWSHPAELALAPAENPANTGGVSAVRPAGPDAARARAVGFDEAFARAEAVAGSVRLVKLDVEGAEWPILATSAALGRAGAVVGEYHACDWNGRAWGPTELAERLSTRGFRVRVEARDETHGLFWADRGE
jgi:FkbM family methyltransferase